MAERRKVRLRYTELYVQQRAGSLAKREVAELDRLEDEYAFHDLVFFRCCALKRLRDEKKKVLERKKTSWYSRFVGAHAHKEEEEGTAGAAPLMTLTREERESLLSAMDVPPLRAGETPHYSWRGLSPEQRVYTAALAFDEVSVRLVDPAHRLDTSATLLLAALQVEGKAVETSMDASVHSLTVMEMLSGRTLCGRTAPGALQAAQDHQGGGEEAALLTVAVQRKRGGSQQQTRVCARMAEVDVMFDPVSLHGIADFWQVPSLSLSLSLSLCVCVYCDTICACILTAKNLARDTHVCLRVHMRGSNASY